MQFLRTKLDGVILVKPQVHHDGRGFFLETYHREKYTEGGIDVTFVQDNHSRSTKGTLRGLHGQHRKPQGKLIRAVEGEILDVAVDVRRGSPTYGEWIGEILSAENHHQLYVPPEYLHGFYVLSDIAQVEYKCTDVYDPGYEIGVAWDDPEIGVEWRLDGPPLLSKKDEEAPRLADVQDLLPLYSAD